LTTPQVLTSLQCKSHSLAPQDTEFAQALVPAQVTRHELPRQRMEPMQLCCSQRMSHEDASLQSTPPPHAPDRQCTSQRIPAGQRRPVQAWLAGHSMTHASLLHLPPRASQAAATHGGLSGPEPALPALPGTPALPAEPPLALAPAAPAPPLLEPAREPLDPPCPAEPELPAAAPPEPSPALPATPALPAMPGTSAMHTRSALQ
jgi:hypothetical protein